jgi:hypothetical protein
MMPIALTVNVHTEDRPADVSRAACWLYEHGLLAIFFVPSALFEDAGFRHHLSGCRPWALRWAATATSTTSRRSVR